jgi:hypothetical protein
MSAAMTIPELIQLFREHGIEFVRLSRVIRTVFLAQKLFQLSTLTTSQEMVLISC